MCLTVQHDVADMDVRDLELQSSRPIGQSAFDPDVTLDPWSAAMSCGQRMWRRTAGLHSSTDPKTIATGGEMRTWCVIKARG